MASCCELSLVQTRVCQETLQDKTYIPKAILSDSELQESSIAKVKGKLKRTD